MGWPLLQRHWDDLTSFQAGTPQSEQGVVYAAKITKAEAEVDFNRPSIDVIRHIHAFNPAPGAWVEGPLGRVKLLAAAPATAQAISLDLAPGEIGPNGTLGCVDGAIQVQRWQFPGSKAQPLQDVLNAGRLVPGQSLV